MERRTGGQTDRQTDGLTGVAQSRSFAADCSETEPEAGPASAETRQKEEDDEDGLN